MRVKWTWWRQDFIVLEIKEQQHSILCSLTSLLNFTLLLLPYPDHNMFPCHIVLLFFLSLCSCPPTIRLSVHTGSTDLLSSPFIDSKWSLPTNAFPIYNSSSLFPVSDLFIQLITHKCFNSNVLKSSHQPITQRSFFFSLIFLLMNIEVIITACIGNVSFFSLSYHFSLDY